MSRNRLQDGVLPLRHQLLGSQIATNTTGACRNLAQCAALWARLRRLAVAVAATKIINEEGGINGRSLELVIEDDGKGMDAELAQNASSGVHG